MHDEWGHLQLLGSDLKRRLAADAVKAKACGNAVQTILKGICASLRDYALGVKDGAPYYQKVHHAEENVLVVSGHLSVGSSKGDPALSAYCTHLMEQHEDTLASIMADGTDDLITDLCVNVAGECGPSDVAKIPAEGLPRHRTHQAS